MISKKLATVFVALGVTACSCVETQTVTKVLACTDEKILDYNSEVCYVYLDNETKATVLAPVSVGNKVKRMDEMVWEVVKEETNASSRSEEFELPRN